MYEAPLEYRLWMSVLDATLFFFANILWFGVALYGCLLWRRARRQIAGLQGHAPAVSQVTIVRSALLRFARVLGLCVALYLVGSYAMDVQSRRSAYACKRSTHGPYVGEACSVAAGDKGGILQGYSGLLRLYDAQSGALLARTFVPNPESGIHWEEDEMWQQGGDENGTSGASIHLPPTAWDRFKARLP